MSGTYNELIQTVRDWSNRDTDVLPNTIIADSLRYAADEVYNTLRIAPFEHTVQYVLIADGNPITNLPSTIRTGTVSGNNIRASRSSRTITLPIPGDLTEFIHLRIEGSLLREVDSDGDATNMADLDSAGNIQVEDANFRSGVVFNERVDIRTLYDEYADKTTQVYWSRQGNNIVIMGDLEADDVVELFYYRRLPALNARFTINAANANNGLVTQGTPPVSPTGLPAITTGMLFFNSAGNPQYSDTMRTGDTSVTVFGNLAPNWLRQENERLVLFGALHQCYDYLGDPLAQVYKQKFLDTIQELRTDELRRKTSGGNIKINYTSYLI